MHSKVYHNKLQFHKNKLFISFWGVFLEVFPFFLEAPKGNNEKLLQNLFILHAGRNIVCLCAYADIKQTTLWSGVVMSRLQVPARHRKEQNAIKIKGAVQNLCGHIKRKRCSLLWVLEMAVHSQLIQAGADLCLVISSLPSEMFQDLGHCSKGWQNARLLWLGWPQKVFLLKTPMKNPISS